MGTSTGNGWLRRLIFVPQENKIYARTHTVETGNQSIFPQGVETLFCSQVNMNDHNEYDQDPSGLDHNFSFDYDLTSALPQYEYDDMNSKKFNDRTVNSVGAGDQLKPSLAMNSTGDFVIVWEDDSDSSDGSGNFDIVARGFQPGGCESFHDVIANGSVTSGQQNTPGVAMDSNGNFVVVWRDDNDGNGIGQIYARGFNSSGSQSFSLMTVNSQNSGQQQNPAVAMDPNGNFVVVWEDDSDSSDGSGNYDIFARGFHPDGTEKFHDMLVNDIADGQQNTPSVAMDSDGNFVVVWRDDNDGNGIGQIYARGFNSLGSQSFARMTVNSVSSGQQQNPSVVMGSDGGFVVVWEDDSDSSGNYDIFARGFNSNGLERFSDITVNPSPGGQHLAPAIASSSSAGFVVTWEDDTDANGSYQIKARGFDSNGAELIPAFTVNSNSDGQQLKPNIAMDSAGNFVIAWQDDMDGNNYYQILARGLDR